MAHVRRVVVSVTRVRQARRLISLDSGVCREASTTEAQGEKPVESSRRAATRYNECGNLPQFFSGEESCGVETS